VHESHDHLVLLCDERDQIHFAVAVQVRGHDVDRAAQVQEWMLLILRTRLLTGRVLEPEHLTYSATAENSDRNVQIAVAVEIERPRIADTAEVLLQQLLFEDAGRCLTKQEELAGECVERRKLSQVGDENVEIAVAIDVDDLRADRDLDV